MQSASQSLALPLMFSSVSRNGRRNTSSTSLSPDCELNDALIRGQHCSSGTEGIVSGSVHLSIYLCLSVGSCFSSTAVQIHAHGWVPVAKVGFLERSERSIY